MGTPLGNPGTMDGVTIKYVDILDQYESQMWYQRCIDINPGDRTAIQNAHIENIRAAIFVEGS